MSDLFRRTFSLFREQNASTQNGRFIADVQELSEQEGLRDSLTKDGHETGAGDRMSNFCSGSIEPGSSGEACGRVGDEERQSREAFGSVAQAASRRLAFCTDGNAPFAFASGRARRSTLAGLAAMSISSPVAGLRPFRFF